MVTWHIAYKRRDNNHPHNTLNVVDMQTHPYLADRVLDKETARTFGGGFYDRPRLMHQRIVISIHNAEGELIGYCGRVVDHTQPRSRVPPRFAKSEVLFNMHRAAAAEDSSVVVVEAFCDRMTVHPANIRSVVALMRVVLYERHSCTLLNRFRQVVLMLDGDVTGPTVTGRIDTMLRPRCPVYVVDLPVGTQPDQLSTEDILNSWRH